MPVTHIPQYQLDAAVRQAQVIASRAAPKTEMRGGDGIVLRRVPLPLYLNATSVHGYKANDSEYWGDMERRHPEIKVKYTPRQLKVCMRSSGPSGKLTRFGRVTFHKSYN